MNLIGRFAFRMVFALCLLIPVTAGAANYDVKILVDVDNNASTGCSVHTMSGVDQVWTTSAATGDTGGSVTGVSRQLCSGGSLGSPVGTEASGWPMSWNPNSGNLTVETRLRHTDLQLPELPRTMRLGFVIISGSATDIVLARTDGEPILFPEAPGRRRPASGGNFVINLDGSTGDWGGMMPLVEGLAGTGAPVLRFISIFATSDNDEYYFRFDAQSHRNAPTAASDAFTLPTGQNTLTITPPGILGNDSDPRSLPLTAILVSPTSHGTLDVHPNGSFTYTSDGSSLTDFFRYKASNGEQESNIARVDIVSEASGGGRPNHAPKAEDDAYGPVANRGTITINAPGVLGNDKDSDKDDTLTAVLVDTVDHGTLTLRADGSFTYTHDGSNTQSDRFTYRVSDGRDFSNTATVTLTIGPNTPPTALPDAYTVTEGGTLTTFSSNGVLANDSDNETGRSGLTAQLVTGPQHATSFTLNSNGSFTYVHNGTDSPLTDTFTYRARDGISGSGVTTVTITITPVNDPPVPVADSYTTNEDTTLTVPAPGVLGNDTDADNATLTATLATNATNGNVVLNPNGSFTYTPNAQYNGPDSFTYNVSDGTASVASSVSITVTPVNDPPSFGSNGPVTVNEDSGAYSQIWATNIVEGPANESAQNVTFSLTGNTNPTLFLVPPSIAPDGTLTFTPAADAHGVATINVTAVDDGGTANGGQNTSTSVPLTITVTAVNDAPVFMRGGDVVFNEDAGPQTINPWATGIAPGPTNEAGQNVNFTTTVTGTTGTLTFLTAPQVSPTGVLTFQANPNTYGTATVSVVLNDDGGTANGGVNASAPQTFTITITAVNDAPTFTAGPNVSADSNAGARTVDPWATGISAGPLETQNVTFEITNNSAPGLFSAGPQVSPTGVLTFTPTPGASGVATITLRITDDGGTANGGVNVSATQTFTISVDASPIVTTTSPAAGATTATNSTVLIVFNEPVTASGNWFQIVCTSSGTHNPGNSTVTNGPSNTFSIDPATDFTQGESCSMTVFGPQVADVDPVDPPDTMAANFTLNFLVDAHPTVATIVPANGATGVISNTNLTVTFSEAVNVNGSTFTLNCTTSGAVAVVVTGGPTTYTLNPATDLAPGETCTVTVLAANVADQDGIDPPDTMAANFVSTFTVDQAPSVTATTPANGAADSLPTTNVTVTFSEPVDVTGNWFQIACTLSGTRDASNSVVTGGPTTFTINPNVDFTPGETCNATIFAANVDDQDANDPPATMLANYNFTFLFDQAPTVTATTPANGATDITTTANVDITFSEPVTAAAGAFTINCATSGAHTFTLTGGPTTYTLNANTDFAPNELCTVTVLGAQVSDNDANDPPDTMAANHVFTFTTDAAPSVTTTTPANAATDRATNADITVNFSESVNVTATFATINCTVSGAHTYATSGSGASRTINPDTDFTQGETCTVTILAGDVADADANDPPDTLLANHVFSFSVDAAPSVVATLPANGATQIGLGENIQLTFSEPVVLTTSSATISCAISGAHTFQVSGTPGQIKSLNPDVDFVQGELCTVTVIANQVDDADANDPPDDMLANYVFSFTTDVAPTVTATTPANGGGASPNANISLTFSEPVVVTGTWFTINCTISGAHTGAVSTADATNFTLDPSSDFTGGETCTVTILAAQINDQDAGDPPANLAADYVFSFSVDAAPTVTSTTPANSATDLGTNTNVTVNFSESVVAGASSFTINCATSGAHAFALSASPSNTYTLNPTVDFAPNELCTVTVVGANVLDNDAIDPPDAMAADYVFTFTTDAAPSVTTTTPANGATDVAGNTNVDITFSEAVTFAGGSFTINCTVSGAHTFALGGTSNSATLNPDTDFTQGETCTVTVLAAGVTDNDANDPPNNPVGDYAFSFTIDAAPTVTSTTPTNGATTIATNANVGLTFSEAVTITNASVTISCGTSGAHTVVVSGGPTNWTVNPDTDFAPNETCTVTVLAAGVADNDANDPPDAMTANYVFSFTTDQAPSVTATTPTNGGGTSPDANVTVTFSEPVDVNGTWFSISCTTSGAHTATVTGGPTTYTLNPDTDFTGGETCTVTVIAGQIDDQDAGDPPAGMLANYVFSFLIDAAPTVTSTTPANGATDLGTSTDITVNFSESVAATASSFTINCATSGAHAFALSASPSNTFTLNPSVDFAPAELCTVTVVAANVTDSDAIDPPNTMAADYVFSFTTDAAPSVTATTPANGATSVAGNTNVDITFSEAVTFAGGSFTINCTTSGAHTFALSGTSNSATLNPDTDFTAGETCTVTVLAAGVTDNDANDPPNNPLANYAFSFTIDAAPSVTGTTPANGSTTATTNTNLTIDFSESVTLSSVTISCATSGAHTSVISASPATSFTVNPDTDFAPGELCTVTVPAAQVTDTDANDPPDAMLANHVFTFTTDQAPSVTANTPTNSGIAAPDSNLTITFSEPVDVAAGWFTITCGTTGTHTAVVTGGPTTFTLNPDTDFTGGETCNVSILSANVTDQDGFDPPDTMLANHNFSFTVDGAPVVVSTTPANGATDRAANTTIQITYDEPVTAGGTAYTIECPTGSSQAFTLSNNGTAVHTLTPTTNLPAGVTCTVTILAAQIADVDANDPPNNMAANYVFSFSTDAPPSVTASTPTSGATGVTSNANVSLTFSESVSLTAAGISCTTSGAHTSVISASPNTTFTVNPDTDFAPGETCTVTILAASVTDTDANDPPDTMAANHVFSFTVDQQPSVTATNPASAAVNRPTNTTIQITFSEAVTAPDAAFTIECPVGAAQAFTGSGSGTTVVTLTPTANLPAGVTCTVTVLAAQIADVDANDPPDNMAANHVFTFSTDAEPAVTTTTPANAGTDVAKTANITVNFTENVDVTTSSFTIKCPSAGAAIPFAFVGSATNVNTVTLNPNTDLPSGELCEVTVIANQVADSDTNDPPNNMAANYVFSFGVEPDAVDDAHPHTHVGNVQSNSAGFFKATTNDVSANPYTITAYDATTANGGTIVMQTSGATMGEFTYNPPPGFEGTDTFTYTISNAHGTDTATVSIVVSGMVWFIDANDATGPFDGRLGSPFNSLAQFEAVNGNADVGNARNPQANDNIFLYQSGTAYVGPVTLENGQKLIGQDSLTAAFGAGSITGLAAAASQSSLPAVNGGDGIFVNISSAGVGVNAAQNNQIRGLRFGNNAGGAIVSANIGTGPGLFVTDALINNGTGGGIDVQNGTISATLSALSTTGGARGIRLNAVNGTVSAPAGTISNATTAAIEVVGLNPTVTFGGTISQTNGRTALTATNVTGGAYTLGTVNVSGNSNNSDAIVIDGSAAIPAVDLTVASVNITHTGTASDGIVLGDLGAGSDVTISGGTITTAAAGRRLINFTGATNCTCNFSGVTLNGSTSDGLSLGATQLGTYTFHDLDVNSPNGGIGVQVVGDANAGTTDSTVSFRSIDINTCSDTGILVHSHDGSFTVSGTGAANSGGTIQSCTNRGARFGTSTSATTGARNISLTDMIFDNNGIGNATVAGGSDGYAGTNTNNGAGIDLHNANTVTLTRLRISNGDQFGINGRNVTALNMNTVEVNNNGNEVHEDGIQIHNLLGTNTWTNLNAHDNASRHVEVQNASGVGTLTINGTSSFTNAVFPSSTVGQQGILYSGHGTANMTASVQNATFTRNFSAAFSSDNADSAIVNVTVNGGSMNDNGQSFTIGTAGSGAMTYALTNVSPIYQTASVNGGNSNVTGISILKGLNHSGLVTGTISNNTMGIASTAWSAAPCTGCNAISVRNGQATGIHNVTISGNTILRSGGGGISIGTGGGGDTSSMRVKILNNTIKDPDNTSGFSNAIIVDNGSLGNDTSTMCADILNNIIEDAAGGGAWATANTIRVRNAAPAPAANLLTMPGYTGGATDNVAVSNYLEARNTIYAGGNASATLGTGANTWGNTTPAGSQCF